MSVGNKVQQKSKWHFWVPIVAEYGHVIGFRPRGIKEKCCMDALRNFLKGPMSCSWSFLHLSAFALPAGWPQIKWLEATQGRVTRWKLCFVGQNSICLRSDCYPREKGTSVSRKKQWFGVFITCDKLYILSYLSVSVTDCVCMSDMSECRCVWEIWENGDERILCNKSLIY